MTWQANTSPALPRPPVPPPQRPRGAGYDTGRDPLNAALDALAEWFTNDLVDEDGEELPDGDQYERLMLAAHDVVDAADRPIGDPD